MRKPYTLTRRAFLVRCSAAGAGLLLGFHLPAKRKFAAAPKAATASDAVAVNAWIEIHPDDSVLIRVARSEMGQGIFTALPMLVAEELDCDWSKVRAEYAPASENLARDNVFGSMSTGGSRSVRGSQDYLRMAGAVAREMLVTAAATRWKVPVDECSAANSVITHTPVRPHAGLRRGGGRRRKTESPGTGVSQGTGRMAICWAPRSSAWTCRTRSPASRCSAPT